MGINKEDLVQLAQKIAEGTASDEEIARYNAWFQSEQYLKAWDINSMGDRESVKTELFSRIKDRKSVKKVAKITMLRRKISVAATALLLLAGGAYFFSKQKTVAHKAQLPIAHKILPGGNTAVLTLADGSRIVLDSIPGTVASQGNMIIRQTGDGEILYDQRGQDQGGQDSGDRFNTISTPPAGQYQVILPDGSRAWLNAASSIRFPLKFNQHNRVVETTGEVYFEVARQSRRHHHTSGSIENIPFIVKTGNQLVEVLGTHFNINAYSDEGDIKTTLSEGSVKVSIAGSKHLPVSNDNSRILTPGQQARVAFDNATANSHGKITVMHADMEEVLAWKNGYFKFNGNLDGIMRSISRWYGAEIIYKDHEVKRLDFGGKISRSRNIEDVLMIMETTGNIHFKIEGRRIFVMK